MEGSWSVGEKRDGVKPGVLASFLVHCCLLCYLGPLYSTAVHVGNRKSFLQIWFYSFCKYSPCFCFYVACPFYYCSNILPYVLLTIQAGTTVPLQGAWNFFVYSRPRYLRNISTRISERLSFTSSLNLRGRRASNSNGGNGQTDKGSSDIPKLFEDKSQDPPSYFLGEPEQCTSSSTLDPSTSTRNPSTSTQDPSSLQDSDRTQSVASTSNPSLMPKPMPSISDDEE